MSVVSIVRLQKGDVAAAVRKAVSMSDGFESVAWEGAEVLIKPNTVLPAKTGTGIVTDASVVAAVTKLVLERKPKKIIVGEGSSVGYDFRENWNSMHCMEIPPLKGKPVVLGRCAKQYRDQGIFVPGCPPHGLKITAAAGQALEIDQNVVHRAIAELHNFSAD